jgi:hypothetical protein
MEDRLISQMSEIREGPAPTSPEFQVRLKRIRRFRVAAIVSIWSHRLALITDRTFSYRPRCGPAVFRREKKTYSWGRTMRSRRSTSLLIPLPRSWTNKLPSAKLSSRAASRAERLRRCEPFDADSSPIDLARATQPPHVESSTRPATSRMSGRGHGHAVYSKEKVLRAGRSSVSGAW